LLAPGISPALQLLANRSGDPESLIPRIAAGEPMSSMLNTEATINSYPMNAATLIGKPSTLAMGLEVLRISAISQKEQLYQMHYIVKWKWRDCRVMMRCHHIDINDQNKYFREFWRPRLRISEREADDSDMLVQRHTLLGHGWDFFSEEHVSHFRCSFDYTDMPYDTQHCKLTFLIPDVLDSVIGLQWAVVDGEKMTNAEWAIEHVKDWRKYHKTVEFTSPFGPANSSQLVAEFTLQRRPAFLVNTFVVQAFLFYLLSWVGLWIDLQSVPARAAIAVIPVLVTSNMMNSLASMIPPISYDTRLSRILLTTLLMISAHMLEFGIAHYAMRRYKALAEKVEKWEQMSLDEATNEVPQGGPTRLVKIEFLVVKRIHLSFELMMRILSPVAYAIAVGVILG